MMHRMFEIAKSASLMSNHPKYKIGAVLIRKGKPVGLGWNVMKSHPYVFTNGNHRMTLHAELKAMISCKTKADSIFVYREDYAGELAMARPCSMCIAALIEFGVRKIYYTINGGVMMENL